MKPSAGFAGILPELVAILGGVAVFSLLARWILSGRAWSRETTLYRGLVELTEPWLKPLRGHLPRPGGIDLSPVAAAFLAGFAAVLLRLLLTRGQS